MGDCKGCPKYTASPMYMTDIAVEVMSGSLIGLLGYLGACRLAGGMLEARARAADLMTPIESYIQ